MTILILAQVALAIGLFFVVNWIGKHSSTFGYLQLSFRHRENSAPAFNFTIKTLAPAVYIILSATMLYVFRRDNFVRHIWLVAPYYFTFRLSYNIAFGRALLLDWWSQLIQAGVGIGAAYLAYVYLILPRQPLFPGVESIGNQLWVIIALFLYAALNNVRASATAGVRRRSRYARSRFSDLKKRYGSLVEGQLPERYMELVAYAVMVYETFNRPWLARSVERAVFPWWSKTIGPMQVRTTTRLTDREGVVVGLERLRESFDTTNKELTGKSRSRYLVIRMALAKYNRDENYIEEVLYVLHILWAQIATEYRTEFEHMYEHSREKAQDAAAKSPPG